MKRIFLIVFSLLFSIFSFSQITHEIDSLKKELDPYLKSSSFIPSIKDTIVVNSLNEISYKYYLVGDCDTAILFARQAKEVSEKIGYKKGIGVSMLREGFCFDRKGDFPNAIKYFEMALVIFLETGNKSDQGAAIGSIAGTYVDLGNYDKAYENYIEAIRLFELIHDDRWLSNSYINLSLMFSNQKKFDESIQYALKAVPIKERLGDKHGLSIVLANLGASYTSLKNFETGIEYFERSLKLKLEIGDLNSISASYCGLGALYFNQEQFEKAIEYYLMGYEIALKINSNKFLKVSRYGLFRSYYQTKNFSESERFALELIAMNRRSISINFPIFSEKEKELYVKTLLRDFQKFNSFALKRKDQNPVLLETVYNTVLFYKGLLLKSSTAMRNAVLSSGDQELIKNYENWIGLKKEIAKVYANGKSISVLEFKADSIEKALVKKSNVFSEFENEQNITWLEIQSSLKQNQASVEFIHFTHDNDTIEYVVYCALIVKPESKYPEMIELCKESELAKVLGATQGNDLSYINNVYGTRNESKSALYNLIWQPMEKSLAGVKNVFISPSGLLHKISFNALSKSQDVYLCDNYSIEMLASTRNVAMAGIATVDETVKITLFGGINYSTDSTNYEIWNYLEGTQTETTNIAKWLNKRSIQSTHLTQSDATEFEFKSTASNSNILHIATHGFFYPDPKEVIAQLEIDSTENGDIKFRGRGFGYATFVENENPLMRSGLVFAGANDVWSTQNSEREDGVLTAQEVAHIDMRNTQLVVLSACETGLGDIRGSEGVYGLQRAFKMAGVKFIIMSLWQVPDKETAEFMTLFYKRLIKLKDIHLAFNQTQKAMRQKYDPYYWAAFVLIE